MTRNGGFAEFSAVQQDNLVAIGDMPFDIAALAEPVGCVLNGLGTVETATAQNALIFGAGPIGLLMALTLRAQGVSCIYMVDIEQSRLELAHSMGIKAIDAQSYELTQLRRSVDLVIDATGVPAVVERLIDYAANGGNVLVFGVCPPGAKIAVSPNEIFRRQIRIAGAHSLNHNIPAALNTIKAIGPEISKLISHRLPLEEVSSFLGKDPSNGKLKVQMMSA